MSDAAGPPVLDTRDQGPPLGARRSLRTGETTRSGGGGTRFPIGSVTKLLTALVAARLDAELLVAWDRPVGPPVDGLTSAEDGPRSPTIRDLLFHRATAPFELEPDHWADGSLTSADLERAAGLGWPSIALPSGTWHYSNFGYALAAAALENALGHPFADLIVEWVSGPLGMTSTSLPDPEREGPPVLGAGWAAGDLWSTVDDLLLLGAALDGDRDDVITPGVLRRLFSGCTPALTSRRLLGPGFTIRQLGERAVIISAGIMAGNATCLAVNPRREIAVVSAPYCPLGDIESLAIDPWVAPSEVSHRWWLDGQEVLELSDAPWVDLVLPETSWPFPLFSGERVDGVLRGRDWLGRNRELIETDKWIRGPELSLSATPIASAYGRAEQ